MTKRTLLEQHYIQQALFPDTDSEQWLAYLTLKEVYPELTYWSYDAYHCQALADYSKGIVWDRDKVIDWHTKEVLLTTDKMFWECTRAEICKVWLRVNGETFKTKLRYLE